MSVVACVVLTLFRAAMGGGTELEGSTLSKERRQIKSNQTKIGVKASMRDASSLKAFKNIILKLDLLI